MGNLNDAVSMINANRDQYVKELSEFLKLESVSNAVEKKKETQVCAEAVAGFLKSIKMENVRLYPQKEPPGHPIVYGEWLKKKGAKTVLIYGHYDVQPVDPLDLWTSPPFKPVVKDGKIYARGATDDKGQLFTHIKSIEALMAKVGELPVNVKFLIEGEEEVGSPNLETFIRENSKLLKADLVLISDSSMLGKGMPSITYGVRGLTYLQVNLTGPDHDLHSGSFGGAVENPVNVLAQMVSKLRDESGKILIPGFYDDVAALTKEERAFYREIPFDEAAYKKDIKVDALGGEQEFSVFERLWARPTLDCNGILGGYTGEGAKTVLPSKAMAKISMRLVPNQRCDKIAKLATAFIKKIVPRSVKLTVQELHGGNPYVAPLKSPGIQAAAAAMEKAFEAKCRFNREGGSIPIVVVFKEVLGIDTVFMGFGLNDERAHSPNECFDLDNFHRGILASVYFLDSYARA